MLQPLVPKPEFSLATSRLPPIEGDPLSHREFARFLGKTFDLRVFDTGQTILRFVGDLWPRQPVGSRDEPQFLGPALPSLGAFTVNLRTDQGDSRGLLTHDLGGLGEHGLQGSIDKFPELARFLTSMFELTAARPNFLLRAVRYVKGKFQQRRPAERSDAPVVAEHLPATSQPAAIGAELDWFDILSARKRAEDSGVLLSKPGQEKLVALVGQFAFCSDPPDRCGSLAMVVVDPRAFAAAEPNARSECAIFPDPLTDGFLVNVFISHRGRVPEVTLHLDRLSLSHLKHEISRNVVLDEENAFVIRLSPDVRTALESVAPLPLSHSSCGATLGVLNEPRIAQGGAEDFRRASAELRTLLTRAIEFLNASDGWKPVESREVAHEALKANGRLAVLKLEEDPSLKTHGFHYIKMIPREISAEVFLAVKLGGKRFMFNQPMQLDLGIRPSSACFWILGRAELSKVAGV